MELLLLIIIVLQFSYMVYKDQLNAKEREKLQLKLLSKDVGEYVHAMEKPKEDETPKEENPYLPIEEASIEQILKAKVND